MRVAGPCRKSSTSQPMDELPATHHMKVPIIFWSSCDAEDSAADIAVTSLDKARALTLLSDQSKFGLLLTNDIGECSNCWVSLQ